MEILVIRQWPIDVSPQACAFRDSYEKFKKAGAQVIGISGDDPSSHKVIYMLNLTKVILDGGSFRLVHIILWSTYKVMVEVDLIMTN